MAEPTKLGQARGLALDAESDVVYWRGSLPFPDHAEAGIHRLDLVDGSDEVLVGFERSGIGLALDPVSDHLYWSDQGGIWRSDLDGNDIQLVIPDAGNVASIVVAPVPEPGGLALALVAFALAWLAGGGRLSRRGRK